MAANGPAATLVAFNRFGLGARPGDLARIAGDPRGALLQEMQGAKITVIENPDLKNSPALMQLFYMDQQERRMERERVAQVNANQQVNAKQPPAQLDPSPAPPQMMAGPQMAQQQGAAPAPVKPPEPPKQKPNPEQLALQAETMARLRKQMAAPIGFVERLVSFWSNHFAISVAKGGPMAALAGAYEREAIRPHVLGRFSTMLREVAQHPAMILYLDNQRSVGPNARAGQFAGRGLNENLAREILELHTLGVGAYGQGDVGALARIITGWSLGEAETENGEPGAFVFKANWHEPGPQTLLGKVYDQPGRAQGEAALADLARHPATAKHLATKLVRHFIADQPPEDLVTALAQTYLKTDGDLAAVSAALVRDDRAWRAPLTKIRTPNEFMAAMARASQWAPENPGLLNQGYHVLGAPLWRPPSPNGFSDATDVWASPAGMKARLDVAWRWAQKARDFGPPMDALRNIFGEAASSETRQAVERAESPQQAFALLFLSPEFQRR
jgi:uncharacterized protein (DUF1800 family)